MKLSIQCSDHQCRYIVGIENLVLLQNDRCDDLVDESWCGFDFGYCDSPLKLIVTLKGDLKIALSSVAGIYNRDPNAEYANWLQVNGTNAIWYDTYYGGWNIGLQDDLGSSKTLMYTTYDVARPQIATNWEYDDGRLIESNDILVDSFDESGT